MKPQEANKLIAEFMGNGYRHTSQDRYHTSWDWLMPVVGKIYDQNPDEEWHGPVLQDLTHALCTTDLRNAYKAVIKYITKS